MIHGLSKYSTTGAASGLDYFLADTYTVEATGEVREREPRPVLLEGNPEALKALCNSLEFKHKYTSGVLSFSPEETERIASTKGLKEQILDDFKEFAFAGVRDDCRNIVMVEHNHTGRLEVHYMIPRVSLESGKYFNPFPPVFDSEKGDRHNHTHVKHNDAFIDYMCEEYGLQNPRDPQFARSVNIKPFSPNGADKKDIVKAIEQGIDDGLISSREDMFKYLERSCDDKTKITITRKGEDYFSLKINDNKAIRLKGPLYGRESYGVIAKRLGDRAKAFEVSRAGFKQRYMDIHEHRSRETENRHKLPQEVTEKIRANELRSTSELKETKQLLRDVRHNIDNYYTGARHAASSFACKVMQPAAFAAASSSPSALSTPDVDTGNKVMDELLREYLSELVKIEREAQARVKRFWSQMHEGIRELTEQLTKGLQDIFKLNVSIDTGLNFYRPGEALFPSVSQYKQELSERIQQVEQDLRLARVAQKQEERVRRVREPLAAFAPAAGGLPTGGTKSFAEAAAELAEESRKAGPALRRAREKGEDAGLES